MPENNYATGGYVLKETIEKFIKQLDNNKCTFNYNFLKQHELEICEVCGKEIPKGTGDEFLDKSCGYRFWLCDECIEKGDMY